MSVPDPVHVQEERILAHILRIIAVVGIVALIPSLMLAFKEKLWVVVGMDFLLYAYALLLVFRKGLPFRLKTLSLTLSSYILGAVLLVFTGPFGAGVIYLFAFILLTALFFSIRWTITANILSIATLLAFGVLNYKGILNWQQGMGSMAVIIANFTLISALLSYGTSHLMNGMRYRVKEEILLRQELDASLREKSLLLKELNHRVRNSVQQIISLIRLRYRRLSSSEGKLALLDIENRVGAISRIYDLLYRSDFSESVPADRYIQLLVEGTRKTLADSHNDISFRMDMDNVPLSIDQLTPCGLIINEVVTNAFKHAFPAEFETLKMVTIILREEGDCIHITIKDNGVGFDPEEKGDPDSLGRKLLSTLVEIQLGGSLRITSGNQGTTVHVTFRKFFSPDSEGESAL